MSDSERECVSGAFELIEAGLRDVGNFPALGRFWLEGARSFLIAAKADQEVAFALEQLSHLDCSKAVHRDLARKSRNGQAQRMQA